MSAYTTYDFAESVNHYGLSGFEPSEIVRVIAAWGNGGPTDWRGGFLLAMRDGRFAYVEGWNDYSGWGCQDGVEVRWFDTEPDRKALFDGYESWQDRPESWDEAPADLNLWLERGRPEPYTEGWVE